MLDFLRAPIARLAPALLGLTGGATAASASSAQIEGTVDYKLELLTPKVPAGPAHLVVRFVGGRGQPVPGAIVTATRLDTSPAGMASMTAPVAAAKGAKPGLYRFDANFNRPGRWALTVAAEAPGQKAPMTATYTVSVDQ